MLIRKGLPLFAIGLFSATVGAESAKTTNPKDVDQKLIEQRANELLQADPQTILRIRKSVQENSAARQAPIVSDFEPEIPQEVLDIEDLFEVSLEPDQPAPRIFISRYQSSAVSFVDAYGNPWPIRKISNFLDGLVLIDKAIPDRVSGDRVVKEDGKKASDASLDDPQAGSFTITALKHGVVGNITVYLYNLPTPISILLTGKNSMYHRISTIRVADVGPQTDPSALFKSSGVTIGTEADPDLNNALYGVSPVGSEAMVVQGAEGKAWLKGEFLFLQTPISVFSPEIIRASHGNGKYKAYKLPRTTTVIGTNVEGRTVTLKILRSPASGIFEKGSTSGGSR